MNKPITTDIHWTEIRRRAALERIAQSTTARPHDPEVYTPNAVRQWTAALIAETASVPTARRLLTALTHDSLPKPMLTWDSLGRNTTTMEDIDGLINQCQARIQGAA